MPSCCVKTCPNRGAIAGVTFHKVPFKLKETWYKILSKHGMKNVSVHMVVCSDHFKEQDLDRDGFRTILKKGALPCLYLDRPRPESEDHVVVQKAHNKLVRVLKRGLKKLKKTDTSEKREDEKQDDNAALFKSAAKDLNRIKNNRRNRLRGASSSQFDFQIHYPTIPTVTAQNEVIHDPTWFSEDNVRIVDVQSILRSRQNTHFN